MNGYGEFTWIEGKKYIGFYKNDKKDGFGIYYWPNNRYFIGFWRAGKQNGVGKYIKGEVVKYGLWDEGKREKWFVSEDEFASCLDPRDERYASIFQWNKSQLKKYMEIGGNSEDNENRNENNYEYKSVKSLKSTKSIKSVKSLRSRKDDDDNDYEDY